MNTIPHEHELTARWRLEGRIPLARLAEGASWHRARDQRSGDRVVLFIVSGSTALETADAARRTALIEDPRLLPVLDVVVFDDPRRGETSDRSVPPTAVVVYPMPSAPPLAAMFAKGTLRPETARSVIGEAAQGLEAARRRGVRHQFLDSNRLFVDTGSGAVTILGTGVEAASHPGLDRSGETASFQDTASLTALLFRAIAGRSARRGPDGLVPRMSGLAGRSVPTDLDVLCDLVLNESEDDFPETTRELLQELGPWQSIPVTLEAYDPEDPATAAAAQPPAEAGASAPSADPADGSSPSDDPEATALMAPVGTEGDTADPTGHGASGTADEGRPQEPGTDGTIADEADADTIQRTGQDADQDAGRSATAETGAEGTSSSGIGMAGAAGAAAVVGAGTAAAAGAASGADSTGSRTGDDEPADGSDPSSDRQPTDAEDGASSGDFPSAPDDDPTAVRPIQGSQPAQPDATESGETVPTGESADDDPTAVRPMPGAPAGPSASGAQGAAPGSTAAGAAGAAATGAAAGAAAGSAAGAGTPAEDEEQRADQEREAERARQAEQERAEKEKARREAEERRQQEEAERRHHSEQAHGLVDSLHLTQKRSGAAFPGHLDITRPEPPVAARDEEEQDPLAEDASTPQGTDQASAPADGADAPGDDPADDSSAPDATGHDPAATAALRPVPDEEDDEPENPYGPDPEPEDQGPVPVLVPGRSRPVASQGGPIVVPGRDGRGGETAEAAASGRGDSVSLLRDVVSVAIDRDETGDTFTMGPEEPEERNRQAQWILIGCSLFVILVMILAVTTITSGLREKVTNPLDTEPPTSAPASPSEEPTEEPTEEETSEEPTEEAAPAPTISNIEIYDNGSSNGPDNVDQAPRMNDGDPGTFWSSQYYARADFAGVKDGLGVRVSFEEKGTITSVTLRTAKNTGGTIELRPIDENGEVGQPVATGEFAGDGDVTMTPEEPVEASGMVLWITELPPDSDQAGKFRGRIAEITIE